jgi:hypothetical protein
LISESSGHLRDTVVGQVFGERERFCVRARCVTGCHAVDKARRELMLPSLGELSSPCLRRKFGFDT